MVDRTPQGDDGAPVPPARSDTLGAGAGDGPARSDHAAPDGGHGVTGSVTPVTTGEGREGGGRTRSESPAEERVPRPSRVRRLRQVVVGGTVFVALLPLLLIIDSYLIVFDIGALARKAPDRSRVMERRLADPRTPRPLRHRFVPLRAMSPHLAHAVVVHEDATFYQHRGFDEFEIRAALRKSLEERRPVRGASTITTQLARNLYLGTERNLLRKLREIPLTVRLERALEKRRILELYLNFAEWGPGVFGAEAASRYHFGVSAGNLSPAQAALLAAALPSPRRSKPAFPSPYLRRRAAIILARMQARGWLSAEGREEGRLALGLKGKPAEPAEISDDFDSGVDLEYGPEPGIDPEYGPEPEAEPELENGTEAEPLPEAGQPQAEPPDPNAPPPAGGDGASDSLDSPNVAPTIPPAGGADALLPDSGASPALPDPEDPLISDEGPPEPP
jgi:monofunctional glycosyltransferase